jgi:hypothetical protein
MARWRTVGASVPGRSHQRRGVGCQDAHAVVRTSAGLLLAVADGAGSARRAAEGAQLAVGAAVHWAQRGVTDPAALASRARSCLRTWAGSQADLRELATTRSIVMIGPRSVRVAQVGDGAVVIAGNEGLELLRADDGAEYLNETVFLTSAGWRRHLRRDTRLTIEVQGVAVLSDGLQLLALDLAAAAPHPGFFDPLFTYAADDESSDDELAAFLASPRVTSRTDDDATLVIAALAA